MRSCKDCGTDISHRHIAAILCEPCFKQRRVTHGARKTATCATCGIPIYKGRGSRIAPTCRDCRAKARTLGKTCEICGKPRRKNAQRFCSQACNAKARQITLQCDTCGKDFTRTNARRRYCSRECAMQAHKAPAVWKWRCLLKITGCPECGRVFTHDARIRRRYCTPQCGSRHKARNDYANRPDHYLALAHRRRSRLLDQFVDDVNPTTVFERDRWRCHICGGKVRRTPRGKRDPEMASLDHLVPLAHGGEHSYANTACAHLRCNLSKGTRAVGEQLALIG